MNKGERKVPPGDLGTRGLTVLSERWEHGSDFHLALDTGSTPSPWSDRPHALWGSGRDALRALIEWGRSRRGWRRILVPTYYCHEVTAALLDQLEVRTYAHAPTSPASPVEAGIDEVVLVVALFGTPPTPAVSGEGVVVEDHSHDPFSSWSIESVADYAIASLRKTLPLPDGGVLWSPRGLAVPAERPVTLDHDRAALKRLLAMTLKRHYLDGGPVRKKEMRALAIDGEREIGQGEISGVSSFTRCRLPTLPAGPWREARATNLRAFRTALGELPGAIVLEAPFAATLLFDQGQVRDQVREALIAARIYPAVLWPLEGPGIEGIPSNHVDLGRRILSIHCDYRYDPADMARVAAEIRRVAGAQ